MNSKPRPPLDLASCYEPVSQELPLRLSSAIARSQLLTRLRPVVDEPRLEHELEDEKASEHDELLAGELATLVRQLQGLLAGWGADREHLIEVLRSAPSGVLERLEGTAIEARLRAEWIGPETLNPGSA